MDASAGLSGVEAEAGLGVGVVGDLGAAVGVEGGVGLAGGDDLDAARAEKGTETDAEGEGEGLFGLTEEMAAGVVTAVGGIEDDEKAGLGRGWGWLRNGRDLGCEGRGCCDEECCEGAEERRCARCLGSFEQVLLSCFAFPRGLKPC
jgi:hypothetical protein